MQFNIEKRSLSQTLSNLPKLGSNSISDASFKDDNLRLQDGLRASETHSDIKLGEQGSYRDQFDYFATNNSTKARSKNNQQLSGSGNAPLNLNFSKSAAVNFYGGQASSSQGLRQMNTIAGTTTGSNRKQFDFKLKTTSQRFKSNRSQEAFSSPENSVADFYLKGLLSAKTSIDENMSARRRVESSRMNQSSLLDTPTLTQRIFKQGRSGSQQSQIVSDLAQIAQGKSKKVKFFDSLTASLRTFFLDKKEFVKLFDDIDVASYCAEEVNNRIKCYRSELGSLQDKIKFTYEGVIRHLLGLIMKLSNNKDQQQALTQKESEELIEKLHIDKAALEEKFKNYRKLMDIRDSENKMLEYNIDSLHNEIKMLQEILFRDSLQNEAKQQQSLKREGSVSDIVMNPEQLKTQVTKKSSVQLEKDLFNLQDSIKQFEKEQEEKEGILKKMNNYLKAMLRGGKKEAWTQVDEAELTWSTKYLIDDQKVGIRNDDIQNFDHGSININKEIKEGLAKKQEKGEVSTMQEVAIKEKLDGQDEQKSVMNSSRPSSGGSQGARQSLQNQGSKQDKPDTIKEGKVTTVDNVKSLAQGISDNWNMPIPMIVMLNNVIKDKETANVLPWNHFKRAIYDIYLDRLTNSIEIQNHLMTAFMPLSEFVCNYFLRMHRLRRIAEIKLLEFLVSLRYYMKHWHRALTFANLANISTSRMGPNNMISGEGEEYDLYVQNYYLFALSKVLQEPAFLYDNYDGITYIYKDRVDDLIDQIMPFASEDRKKRFQGNLVKNYRYFNDGQGDKNGYDIDKLLQHFIDEFIEVRNLKTDQILKSFYKDLTESGGDRVLSLDELMSLTSEIIDNESPVTGYIYPKELTISRAFMFSLTSGKNTFSMTANDFVQGITRLGINSPLPFISITGTPQVGSGLITSKENLDDPLKLGQSLVAKKQLSASIKKKSQRGSFSNQVLNLPFLKGGSDMKTNKSDDDNISVRGPGNNLVSDGRDTAKRDKAGLKIDSTSTMFAQHFSIIREMKTLVDQFRDMVKKEHDGDVLKKIFEDVLQVLDKGCHFLQFPIKY